MSAFVGSDPVGKKIKELRKRKGLKQFELANEIGVTRQQINAWENSTRIPKNSSLIKISDALDLTPDECLYLLNGRFDTHILAKDENTGRLVSEHTIHSDNNPDTSLTITTEVADNGDLVNYFDSDYNDANDPVLYDLDGKMCLKINDSVYTLNDI